MASVLKEHFPMIRDRGEVVREINDREVLRQMFDSWTKEQQEEFLDICTGMRGAKILSDAMFKEIFNPDTTPERLEVLLTLILKRKVKILKVLPNDSARISAENSLLILDIVVQLEDGSIANVEMQRMGYYFPGQRSACYSADLLLRQYKRVKGEKGKTFKYSDIKKVYTIVFYEKSTKEFHKFSEDIYIHRSKQQTDTGLKIDLLQEYTFIALDIFRKKLHNKGVEKNNELEAWLTFFGEDDPEYILKLIAEYPEFEVLYQEVYELCRNMERMMGLFSEELAILDENTVQFMIDDMQGTIDEQREQLSRQEKQLSQKNEQLDQQSMQLSRKDEQLNSQKKEIEQLKKKLEEFQELKNQ